MKAIVMMTAIMLNALMLVTAVTAEENSAVPADWETREHGVWVQDGIIYARGSAKMSTMNLSIDISASRARANLANALTQNEIAGYASLPKDTKEPTPFNSNGISGTLGDIQVISRSIGGDGAVLTLISCTGAELTQ